MDTKYSKSKTKLINHSFIDKKLIPPLASLNMKNSSWINDRMPEMLWAVLFTNSFKREDVLNRFATIIDLACQLTNKKVPDWRLKPLAVTLSGIANLEMEVKQKFIEVIAKDDLAKQALAPMLFFDNLPDKQIWKSVLKLSPTQTEWENLAKAIGGCFDHQSQKATDCRWVKALYMIKSEFITFTTKVQETPKLIFQYPTHNEEQLRWSRPSVRSLEIATDIQNSKNEWSKLFWDECYKKTRCLTHSISEEEMTSHYPTHSQLEEDKKKLQEISQNMSDHFWKTLTGSERNPKHEVVFGLALYAMDLVSSSILIGMGRTSQGRMVLRGLVECLITLKYLVLKDEPNLWRVFQLHGMGQAKLVLQRSEEMGRSQKYFDQEKLGQIANDDVWVEFLPIDTGSWDDSDLRKRAIDVGLKDKYDDYFTWTSSYTHGQWGAIRESIYDLCGNPLHRFHRIPLLYSLNLKDANDDLYILLNDIVDLLYQIYPKEKKYK